MASGVTEDSEILSLSDIPVKKPRRKKHGKVVTSTPLSVAKRDQRSSGSQQSASTSLLFEVTGHRFATALMQFLGVEKSWKSEFTSSTSAFIRFSTAVLRSCRNQMPETGDISEPLLAVSLLLRQSDQLEQAKKLSQGRALTECFQKTVEHIKAMENCRVELQSLVNRLLALITLDDFNNIQGTDSPQGRNSASPRKPPVLWAAIVSPAGEVVNQLGQDALLRSALLTPEGLRCLCAGNGEDVHRIAALWKHSGSLVEWSGLTVPVWHLLSTGVLQC